MSAGAETCNVFNDQNEKPFKILLLLEVKNEKSQIYS